MKKYHAKFYKKPIKPGAVQRGFLHKEREKRKYFFKPNNPFLRYELPRFGQISEMGELAQGGLKLKTGIYVWIRTDHGSKSKKRAFSGLKASKFIFETYP